MLLVLGDFKPGDVVRFPFNTADLSQTPVTLTGGTVKAYKDADASSEATTGITLTTDFDSVTGLHAVAIDTSSDATFYAAGSTFWLVLTAGTVDGTSVVGVVLASFTLQAQASVNGAVVS